MYYTIYCNEKLLLKNLDEYQIPNRLLKKLLYKDTETTLEEKLEIYFENRRYDGDESVVRHPALDTREQWDEEAGRFMRICDRFENYKHKRWMQEDFFEDENTYLDDDDSIGWTNPYCCYVECEYNPYFEQFIHVSPEDLEWKLDENRKAEFEEGINRARTKGWHLREVDSVTIYKKDIDNILKAKKKHKLTEFETSILFGMVFVTRLYGWKHTRLNTKNRVKGFKACFNRHVSDDDIAKVAKTGLFKKVGDGRNWYDYDLRNDWYRFKYDWKYLDWDVTEEDEVAYVFNVTIENNELNLSEIYKEAMPNQKFCCECGEAFVPSSNRAKYCSDCKAEILKEQRRAARERYKERKGI